MELKINIKNPNVSREKFMDWVKKYKPDSITRIVLGNLVQKYMSGDEEPLFRKRKELEMHEHYRLCAAFHSCLEYLDLNKEYSEWASQN